jgi:phage/plasmid-like protein (TIGR03299 family)
MSIKVFSGLGMGNCNSVAEAIKRFEFAFTAEKRASSWCDDNGNWITCHDPVVIRLDTMVELGRVGPDYALVQYEKAFDWIDVLLNNGDAKLIGGGCPNRGEQAFLIMESDGEIMLAPGDSIKNVFFARSSHDGSCKIEVRMTPYREKTGTTFALDASKPLAFKHTPGVHSRMARAKRTFSRVQISWDEFSRGAKKLIATPISDEDAKLFIKGVLDIKKETTRSVNIEQDIYQLFKNTGIGTRIPACRGTLFGLVQTFSEWGDLHRTVRKSHKKTELAASIDAKLIADTAKKKQKAWGMALNLRRKKELAGVIK